MWCSSGYVCLTGIRVPPLGSFCEGGMCSVRGGVPGSTVHLSPHPCLPHCSGPTGRPLHDRGDCAELRNSRTVELYYCTDCSTIGVTPITFPILPSSSFPFDPTKQTPFPHLVFDTDPTFLMDQTSSTGVSIVTAL
ncbi:hypothetical protein PFLUV_G00146190 [Perca fluviatilis]|uniref:Uncharacterized protein n=1 Tax=Perca fluviatilis TaxID=8168 RepID=A0A6A5E2V6_PERFL|nr:hypothetical protein PFLUV_G00146190 [Perca fluviatilis]